MESRTLVPLVQDVPQEVCKRRKTIARERSVLLVEKKRILAYIVEGASGDIREKSRIVKNDERSNLTASSSQNFPPPPQTRESWDILYLLTSSDRFSPDFWPPVVARSLAYRIKSCDRRLRHLSPYKNITRMALERQVRAKVYNFGSVV